MAITKIRFRPNATNAFRSEGAALVTGASLPRRVRQVINRQAWYRPPHAINAPSMSAATLSNRRSQPVLAAKKTAHTTRAKKDVHGTPVPRFTIHPTRPNSRAAPKPPTTKPKTTNMNSAPPVSRSP